MSEKKDFRNIFFVLPALIIFAVFYIYPFIKVFQLSMYEWNGISPTMKFVGLANFKELIGDKAWWFSLKNAAYITLWALTFQNILALLLALACNSAIRVGSIYRVIFFIPPILSEIVVGLVWKWIFDGNYGIFVYWLSQMVFFKDTVIDLLGNKNTALTTIAIIHSWKGFGWAFIILLAGLQTIPQQLYEAARVDGAGPWKRFWHITVPLMIPVFVLVIILTILGTMQGFALILAMTGGGPAGYTEVPVIRIINAMLSNSRFGYACAMALVFGAILVAVSFTLNQFSRKLKQV